VSAPSVSAALLIIGNEILSGQTRDANLAFLGAGLNAAGVRLLEARVVADGEAAIVAAVNELRRGFDYLFTTGGIGPTHDDITAASVAKAFGVPLVLNPEARRILEGYYPPGELNEARLRMAHTPEGASLVENPISGAPGFQIGNVFVLAGIPAVMQAMFESLRHRLTGGRPLVSETVVAYLPEGRLAAGLGAIQSANADVEIGSYPFHREGRYGARLVIRAVEPARLAAVRGEVEALVRALGAEPETTSDP
jgi:molybdenum cofactor synthesis domain-containing protein